MSNYFAIPTVTETLRHLLQTAVDEAVGGGVVEAHRPEAAPNAGKDRAAVNIFLYQVAPNVAWRNRVYETRTPPNGKRSADDIVARQRFVAVNLHYLFSFYGNEQELEPQRLLGVTLATLEANARLARATISDLRKKYARLGSDKGLGEDSFLDGQVEEVMLTPLALNLEELSKLWSVFFQVPYALSVAYEASVVLLDVGGPVKPPLVTREPQIGTVMGEPETWDPRRAEELARLRKEGEAKEAARKAEEAEGEAPSPSEGAGGVPPKRPGPGQDKP